MLKLDNGTELFTGKDMDRLRSSSSGRLGGRSWVGTTRAAAETKVGAAGSEKHSGCASGGDCRCQGRCVRCACLERAAALGAPDPAA